MGSQPLSSLSLDLDNQWSYMKTHGDPGWQEFPSYLDRLVEIVLPRLRHHGLRVTVFVVGRDAALEKNREALSALAADGHEIGNHSFHHEPWLHRYSRPRVANEIERAEQAIEDATGRRPRGFRGPGYSLSPATLDVLAERGYRYDASTLPTFLGPLARAYYFWRSSGLSAEEREQRRRLFGGFSQGLQPLRPYRWSVGGGDLIEIPVTTLPLLRTPFHLSYLLYLAGFNRALAMGYLGSAITACRLFRLEPSFLLHPLDFLGGDRVSGLQFFPGMNLDTGFKLELFDRVIERLTRSFRIVPLQDHAAAAARGALPLRRLQTVGGRA